MTRSLGLFFCVYLTSVCEVFAEDLAESLPESIYFAKVSIIIDDLGYGLEPGRQLAQLPYPVTFSIIPFTPYGADVAVLAKAHEKEVMLHAPMETLNQRKWESGLTATMDEHEILEKIDHMLRDIPHVQGVNNHGGSKLTQDRERMEWIMTFLAEKHLYFVDSRTIASSEASAAAQAADVQHASRDVFLDNEKSPELIRQQIHKLRRLAMKKGRAIGIGHPYPETIQVLVEELPKLSNYGIELVSVSNLVFREKPRQYAPSEDKIASARNLLTPDQIEVLNSYSFNTVEKYVKKGNISQH